MGHFSLSTEVKSSDFDGLGGGFSMNSGFWEVTRNGLSSSSSLVLDCERGELVEAQVRVDRKVAAAERTVAALKNHSEAERRRRARINAHLDTLRNLIPGAKKMDKAALLGEVIGHLKELKEKAAESSKGFMIPVDVDEVRVEEQKGLDGASCSLKASLCSDYKPGLLPDLRQALDGLHLKTVRGEIATLGDRMKLVFLIASSKEGNIEDTEVRQFLARSVRQTLRSVVDKFSSSQDFSLRTTLSNKKRRVSLFDSQSSFSAGDFW